MTGVYDGTPAGQLRLALDGYRPGQYVPPGARTFDEQIAAEHEYVALLDAADKRGQQTNMGVDLPSGMPWHERRAWALAEAERRAAVPPVVVGGDPCPQCESSQSYERLDHACYREHWRIQEWVSGQNKLAAWEHDGSIATMTAERIAQVNAARATRALGVLGPLAHTVH